MQRSKSRTREMERSFSYGDDVSTVEIFFGLSIYGCNMFFFDLSMIFPSGFLSAQRASCAAVAVICSLRSFQCGTELVSMFFDLWPLMVSIFGVAVICSFSILDGSFDGCD